MEIQVVLCRTLTGKEIGFLYRDSLHKVEPNLLRLMIDTHGRQMLYSGDVPITWDVLAVTNHALSDVLHRASSYTDFIRSALRINDSYDSDLSVVDFNRFRIGIYEVTEKTSTLIGYKYPCNTGRRLHFSKERVLQPRIARGCASLTLYTKGILDGQPFGYCFAPSYREPKTLDVSQAIYLKDGYTHFWKATVDITKKKGYTTLEEKTYVREDENPDPYEV